MVVDVPVTGAAARRRGRRNWRKRHHRCRCLSRINPDGSPGRQREVVFPGTSAVVICAIAATRRHCSLATGRAIPPVVRPNWFDARGRTSGGPADGVGGEHRPLRAHARPTSSKGRRSGTSKAAPRRCAPKTSLPGGPSYHPQLQLPALPQTRRHLHVFHVFHVSR
jgi:hypothetical protein